jgi:hypothetical protein
MIWLLPPPSPSPPAPAVSKLERKTDKERQLVDEKEEEGRGKEPNKTMARKPGSLLYSQVRTMNI